MTPNKTLANLKADVTAWLNRKDPEVLNMLMSFIGLAEQEFARSVKIPMAEGRLILNIASDGETVLIPSDMLSPIGVSVAHIDNEYIPPQSYTRIDAFAYFDIVAKGTDTGRYFAKYENTFQFYPSLKAGDVVLIAYHQDLTPLNSDSDTSPALQYGYDLMLYWSLKHASVFLRDPEQEQYWTQKAAEALLTMQNTFEELHWAGSPKQILGY